MSLLSNLMIAIIGLVNPVLSFVGSAVQYIISNAKTAGLKFILDLASITLPGGFVKDITLGVIADAIIASSLNSAVNQVVPFNDVVLECEYCSNYSHYYIKRKGNIVCNKCFESWIDDRIEKKDKIFLINNNIQLAHSKLVSYNSTNLSSKYYDFNNTTKFPTLSSKYTKFNSRNKNG